MGNKKNKFNSLTPEVLSENKKIYTEALDYAFGNSNIKNIAITGIHGAGKSSVWNTYIHQKGLSNVITVSFISFVNESYKNFNGISLIILCALLLFIPLFYYLYIFNRGNKFKISKIAFKGAEANVNDNNIDESLFR